MKIRVERSELTDAVGWAARVLPTRPTLPVLAGVVLELSESGRLTVAGSDLEVCATAGVDVTVAEPGRVLVPGRLLNDITRSLPSGPVDLAVEGTRLVVRCGTTRFTLPLLPVQDYPELPAFPAVAGRIPVAAFTSAVNQVAVAAAREEGLPVLTGIRVEVRGESLTLVATDRYRLSVRRLTWQPLDPAAELTVLVPARTLAEAARSFAGAAHDVELLLSEAGSGENLAGFACGDRRVSTRLLDGEYPRYDSLFPASHEASAEVDTEVLTEAVKRVSLVAPRLSPVRLAFTSDEVTLEAGSGDDAQASETVPARLDGEALTIAFNPGYLLEGLAALGAPTARLLFTSTTKPAVLTAEGSGPQPDFRYLLMPVRLSG